MTIFKIKNRPLFKNNMIKFFVIITLLLLLATCSVLMQYAAGNAHFFVYAFSQTIKLGFAFFLLLLVYILPTQFIFKITDIAYVISLLLVILVNILGVIHLGAQRWLHIGFFVLQPSELMKLALVLALAKYLHKLPDLQQGKIKSYVIPCVLIFIPFIFIVEQPDLGTALIMCFVAIIIFFVSGLKLRYFIILAVTTVVAAPIIWFNLYDYQKERITSFLNPESNPLGSGYHIIQSKIAIGSGGFWGKGYLNGSQSKLNFIPEKQTDFVFALFTEEFGFIGALLLILVYAILIINFYIIAINSKTNFGKYAVIGISSILFAYVFINISMVSGILPIVGVPLPLISYGGTSLTTLMIGFGIALNISRGEDI